MAKLVKKDKLRKIHTRIRKKIEGVSDCPRLSVHRSGKHTYAQVINDESGNTLVQASSLDKELKDKLKHGANKKAAEEVGRLIAQRAKQKSIKTVVFDRGGHLYHGCVKSLANAARQGGLEF